MSQYSLMSCVGAMSSSKDRWRSVSSRYCGRHPGGSPRHPCFDPQTAFRKQVRRTAPAQDPQFRNLSLGERRSCRGRRGRGWNEPARRASLRWRRHPETRHADSWDRRLEETRRCRSRGTRQGDQGEGRELVCGVRRGRGDRHDQHLLGGHPSHAACGSGTRVDAAALADRREAVEGNRPPQQAIIKGDTKSASIAAASILAKVERDTVMRTLDIRHPGYGFADHKGYPVPAHYEALARLGACAAHRRSFGPVRTALGLPPLPPWPSAAEREAG